MMVLDYTIRFEHRGRGGSPDRSSEGTEEVRSLIREHKSRTGATLRVIVVIVVTVKTHLFS